MTEGPSQVNRIETLRHSGDFAGALSATHEALSGGPDPLQRGRLLGCQGRILLDTGANTDAVTVFEEATQALESGPQGELAILTLDLGRAYRRTGQLEPALKAMEDATDQFAAAGDAAGRRRALAARGKVMYALSDWKGARGAFRAALDQRGEEPPAWRLHHAMARAYEKDGRRSEAENCYERARQAGWDGLQKGESQPAQPRHYEQAPSLGAALTVSAGDVLVPHDDEAELARAAQGLEPVDLIKLVSLAGALNSALAPEPLLELLLDRAIEWTNASSGYVVVCRPRRDNQAHVEIRAARNNKGEKVESPEDDISRTIVLQAVQGSKPVVTGDAIKDEQLGGMQSIMDRELRSVACFPLRVRSGPALGAIYLESRETGVFGTREVALLNALSHHVALAFERSTRYQRLADAYNETRRSLEEKTGVMFGLIGRARCMRQVFRLIDKLRDHDAPVLIEGETGTGKELVARAIHRSSKRRDAPFVVEACGALPEGLLEAELFGHEKGAFTGATEARRGAFARAEGGTLFLDEVNDMPARMQALLLRTLESGEVRPIGAPAPRIIDCRIVCASREPLANMVREGRFREDLYFRVNVIRVEVPPLRNRKEDVPALAEAFLKEMGRQATDLSPAALEVLLRHDWPGNIRELRHALERGSLLAGSGQLEPKHLGLDELGKSTRRGLRVSSGSTAGKVEFHGLILNRRQVTLIDYLRANGVATNREYVQLVNVSVPTGWRDIKDLLDKSLIRSEGQGRNTIYRLQDDSPIIKAAVQEAAKEG
ncbi:MAG: sigma 54-interacting transcriptional regulator [Planctomycetes bacterium]|nr:sigma 54-interacting transcriptional regulator [Planctomycetota bacterium]